jgi:hypothetical protein
LLHVTQHILKNRNELRFFRSHVCELIIKRFRYQSETFVKPFMLVAHEIQERPAKLIGNPAYAGQAVCLVVEMDVLILYVNARYHFCLPLNDNRYSQFKRQSISTVIIVG